MPLIKAQMSTNVSVKQKPPLRRIWSPPMDQSYCADHCLDECEAYYRAERVRFEELKAAIQDAFPARRSARGKLPILAGGTGLYLRALLHGLADMPEADEAVRAGIASDAEARGWAALHAAARGDARVGGGAAATSSSGRAAR